MAERSKRAGAGYTRRELLRAGLIAGAALLVPRVASAGPRLRAPQVRELKFRHLHTGERLSAVYWEKGHYLLDALKEIDYLLRDFRTNAVAPIDRGLLDLLAELRQRLGTQAPFEVISGYRSPETNAMLIALRHEVSPRSLHMSGRAIDVRLAGRSVCALRQVALKMGKGGVGYYATKPEFVHVDVGRVRWW
jgi:uncharacterized protein YcbK (DUF882 family)